MADFARKRSENMSGKYFVDDSCISCEACWKEAPMCFKSHRIETYAFVFHQPENESEEVKCKNAEKICPVKAIGHLGVDST